MRTFAPTHLSGEFMVPALTSGALVLHNLGLAAGFGGTLFGKFALNPAVKAISSVTERGAVANRAWNGYNFVNAAAVGTAAVTWLAGRLALSGRSIDKASRQLVWVKDVLMAASVTLGAANIAAGAALAAQAPGGAVPMASGNEPTTTTPKKAAVLQKFVSVLGVVNLGCIAGVIGVTALLNMKAGTSTRWAAVSRLLP